MIGAAPRLSPEYYAEWRKDTAEKVARGEDPYADFAKRARERSDSHWLRKVVNKVEKALARKKKDGKDVRNMKGEDIVKTIDDEQTDDENEGSTSKGNEVKTEGGL